MKPENPFASPDGEIVDPGVAVFSPIAVAIHGLFFTPFFGSAAAALNWIAVGESRRAARTLVIGIVMTMFALLSAAFSPPLFIGWSMMFAMMLYLEQTVLRERWPHLPTAGFVPNVMLAACFFVAVVTVPVLLLVLTMLL